MERRWFDHPFATPIFSMATLPQYRDHYREHQTNPARGKGFYPAIALSLDCSIVLPTRTTARGILDPKQIVAFEVKQASPLGAHLEELEKIGLRAACFWEGVYFDQVAEVGALPDRELYAFGDVLRIMADTGPLADRAPMFLRQVRQLGLVTLEPFEAEVPVGTQYLAVQEISRWGL